MLTKLTQDLNYHQSLADQPNVSEGLTAAQLKEKFDQAANDIKDYLNNTLISELEDSGAGSIGASVAGLVGTTVQMVLDSMKNLVDTKANSVDVYTKDNLDQGQLDNRYYTETELDGGQLDNRYFTEAELQSTGGAAKIGATPIDTSPSTVQGVLEWLKLQIDLAALGALPDGSVLDVKLSNLPTEIKQRFLAHVADLQPHDYFGSDTSLTFTDGNLTQVDVTLSGVLRRRETLAYTGGSLTSVNVKVYTSDGVTIAKEYTDTLTYVDGNLSNVQRMVI